MRVNSALLTTPSLENLPPADGTYFYRVSTVAVINGFDKESDLSDPASGVSDRTPPRAVAITYQPTGAVDPLTGRRLRDG